MSQISLISLEFTMLPSISIVTKYFKCSISSNGNFQLTGASDVPWVFIGGRFIGGAEETVAAHKFDLVNIQSWKMSNLLHGPISTNQILPREKRINRDILGTSNLQNISYVVSCDE